MLLDRMINKIIFRTGETDMRERINGMNEVKTLDSFQSMRSRVREWRNAMNEEGKYFWNMTQSSNEKNCFEGKSAYQILCW